MGSQAAVQKAAVVGIPLSEIEGPIQQLIQSMPPRAQLPSQSGRGYQPFLLTHLRASWVGGWSAIREYPAEKVTWPLVFDGKTHDKNYLREVSVDPWKPWIEAGGSVHIGEMGCHNYTPHATVLAWLDDLLSVFAEQNWGWSLWNLSGSFGIMDSGRKDVKYEDYKGHKLDRQMLEILKKHL